VEVSTEITDRGDVQDQSTRKTTIKRVLDIAEYEASMRLMGRARKALRQWGQNLVNGVVLVPMAREENILAQIEQCEGEFAAFNATARTHRVRMYADPIKVESEPERASREIATNLQELIIDMKYALEACDVEAIRKAAYAAGSFAKIVDVVDNDGENNAQFLRDAVQTAQKAASYIRKQLDLKEMTIEQIKAEIDTSPVEQARVRFLQYAAPVEVEASQVDSQRWESIQGAPNQTPLESAVELDTERFVNLGLLRSKEEDSDN
jgi:hypothetical protein